MRLHQMLVPLLVLRISAPAAAQDQIPAALRSLKPHQIIEAVMAERQALGFTEVQVRRLDSLHLAVRNEPHRYVASSSPKTHQGVRMQPMISKQRAYADALSMLTSDQRNRAGARFADPEYRLPEALQPRRTGGQDTVTDPLKRHTAGAAPAGQATDTGKLADPLQHQGDAQAPPAVQGEGGKPTNPVTHKE